MIEQSSNRDEVQPVPVGDGTGRRPVNVCLRDEVAVGPPPLATLSPAAVAPASASSSDPPSPPRRVEAVVRDPCVVELLHQPCKLRLHAGAATRQLRRMNTCYDDDDDDIKRDI
eukprot:GHVU01138856.1.p5 GENE.GHVU01138856.1~~GHVU01138856.1.p5  ORF type:complete len:114 (-),score=19.22 GHVU01138856.1:769-1110(-)